MVLERVDGVGRTNPARIDRHRLQPVEHCPVALVEACEVGPRGSGRFDSLLDGSDCLLDGVGRGDPVADGRLHHHTGEAFQLVDGDPPALTYHPIDRAVGRGLRGPAHRSDVEDLAAADRLVTTRLTQHEPVARQQRQRDGQEHPHRTTGARRQRVGAQHPQSHRVLAGTHVGDECTPPRHVVIE